ncbi:nucleoside hydrolase [Gordonia sp. PKS22-38]|uniref:Nucleoside hydrolase n=1 Tax=Gordonia prachuapensis TaxID=3115651 RepID=A0ABU7MTR0_9ACTN|nr:nucleoside hydrolase [Gordonia sp. PKS22-38]
MDRADGRDILVDTDGGLDDMLAIRTIAHQQRLWGVTTTWGNVSATIAARNVALAVPDVDVWCGDRTPPASWRPRR